MSFVRKRPKPGVWAALLVASRELMEAPEKAALIVNHAVGYIGSKYSQSEKGLANAVLRKMPPRLAELARVEARSPEELSWRYSHPQWLVERWLASFGMPGARALLEWNQREPETYARWQRDPLEPVEALHSTPWPGFWRVERGAWGAVAPAVDAGRLYIQNPGSRLAPQLLAERFQGGRALDLCAAPGGKSLLLLRELGGALAELVAVDVPGPRFERLQDNLRRFGARRVRALPADARELEPAELGRFQAAILDAPCSNTGVLQRKVDARWRLTPEQLVELPVLQRVLLEKAARFLEPGGLLVYSTCSIEAEENEAVVERFLGSDAGASFRLEAGQRTLPWEAGHDGAGAFVLRRREGPA